MGEHVYHFQIKNAMDIDHIYNKALLELKESKEGYLMFKSFSFMKKDGIESNEFLQIKFLLINSKYFVLHAKLALTISDEGYEILREYGGWYEYVDSIKKQNVIRLDKEKKEIKSLKWSTRVSKWQVKSKWLPHILSLISLLIAGWALYVSLYSNK